MQTQAKIDKTTQAVARLERALARETLKKRKADTRRKIQFGGLVVKAKMDSYAKDIILGALIHAEKALRKDDGTALLYQSLGEAAFMDYGDNNNGKGNPHSHRT